MAARLLHRLAGLETEYVARFRPDDPHSERPTTFQLLHDLAGALRRRLPIVPADHPKKGFFLATGGAFWHERPGEGLDHPLIEGATPECRGARTLLAYQRAQDQLLASAARDVSGGDFTLCKSDCDAEGNVYGAQENYDVVFARGWRLLVWRVLVVLVLVPLISLGWLGMIALMMVLCAYYIAAIVVYLLYQLAATYVPPLGGAQRSRRMRIALFGPPGGEEPLHFMPRWLAAVVTAYEHIVLAPGALALSWAISLLGFGQLRRVLLPFLISRTIVCGSGRLLRDGKFQIAAKASRIRGVNGVGIFRVRSIFSFGPQLKALMLFSTFGGRWFPSLLKSRQRFQINIGDGNLCEEAEYLRIGTTMLLIDLVEAGFAFDVPTLRHPIRAMRTIMSDPTLKARVKMYDGRSLSAIEIQRTYLEACRAFVASQATPSPEAQDILARWANVLDDLERAPRKLIGRLDWITKKWLIETTAARASWDVKKKIDLRYHELSPNGYFERLRSTGIIRSVLSESQVDAAAIDPPPDSPATERGRHIRELLATTPNVRAGWLAVSIGKPPTKVIRLHNDER